MKTLHVRPVSLMVAVFAGFVAAACGSEMPDGVRANRGSQRGPAAVAPSVPSTSPGSQLDSPVPSSIARAAQPAPQDPPTRPTTKEACDACQGLWATHGIEPEETCICKANDEGRACLDGKECMGECLLDGDPEFHIMEQGNPPRGYYTGHCAAYDTTFGCFRHIPDDTLTQLPLVATDAAEDVCVD
jgi:hypothetical protein